MNDKELDFDRRMALAEGYLGMGEALLRFGCKRAALAVGTVRPPSAFYAYVPRGDTLHLVLSRRFYGDREQVRGLLAEVLGPEFEKLMSGQAIVVPSMSHQETEAEAEKLALATFEFARAHRVWRFAQLPAALGDSPWFSLNVRGDTATVFVNTNAPATDILSRFRVLRRAMEKLNEPGWMAGTDPIDEGPCDALHPPVLTADANTPADSYVEVSIRFETPSGWTDWFGPYRQPDRTAVTDAPRGAKYCSLKLRLGGAPSSEETPVLRGVAIEAQLRRWYYPAAGIEETSGLRIVGGCATL